MEQIKSPKESLKGVSAAIIETGTNVFDQLDGAITKALGPRAKEVLIGTTHDELIDAVTADMLDIIPAVGDFVNAMRIIDAGKKGKTHAKRRIPVQMVDFIAGAVPKVGAIADAITPTNTVTYLARRWGKD